MAMLPHASKLIVFVCPDERCAFYETTSGFSSHFPLCPMHEGPGLIPELQSVEVVPVQPAGGPDTVERVARELWEALKAWQHAAVDPDRPGTYTQAPVLSECRGIAERIVAAVGPVGRSCEVTDEMVDAAARLHHDRYTALGVRRDDGTVTPETWDEAQSRLAPLHRKIAREMLEAALGATADKDAHGSSRGSGDEPEGSGPYGF